MSEPTSSFLDPDELWEALLSRDRGKVQAAFFSLEEEQKQAVHSHLQRMVTEPGWQLEQRVSARAALDALNNEA